jgi:predicted dehydrogenase
MELLELCGAEGRHVQVQKPIATTLETARATVETAARRHSAWRGEPAPVRRFQPVPGARHRAASAGCSSATPTASGAARRNTTHGLSSEARRPASYRIGGCNQCGAPVRERRNRNPERTEFHGTKGTAIITGDKLTAWDVAEDGGEPPPLAKEVASGASDPMASSLEPFERQFRDFGEAIAKGHPPLTGGMEGCQALEIVDAIYRSCRTGRKVVPGAA